MSEGAGPGRDPFAPDRWAVETGGAAAIAPVVSKPARRRCADRFLKGPVPWRWLARAMALRGKALAVGLMLWQLRGMTGRDPVLFCLARAAADGIPATTARRAVRALEDARLVSVERRPGRGLEVTILDAPERPAGEAEHPV